jgi:hypothetical protein
VSLGNQQSSGYGDVIGSKASLDILAIEPILIRLITGPEIPRFWESEGFEATPAIAATVLNGDAQIVESAVDCRGIYAHALSVIRRIWND